MGPTGSDEANQSTTETAAAAAAATPEGSDSSNMLVKVCEGLAVTADAAAGLRVWDLRTKRLIAHTPLSGSDTHPLPTCLAIDDQEFQRKRIQIMVGFADGSFGVWELDTGSYQIDRRYQHEKSSNGALAAAAFSYPYLLTATESVLISLYTFERPESLTANRSEVEQDAEAKPDVGDFIAGTASTATLPAPYLLTSLKSHTSRAPLALSIRKTASSTIASIAYTFSALRGWCLGIQDLHLRRPISSSKRTPEVTTTRLAYTLPITTAPSQGPSPPTSPAQPRRRSRTIGDSTASNPASAVELDGPISISYTHPYLLATLPDNTLILYLCTSNASSLSISPGIRLDADITARGKAVSIRVWELEGRAGGRSIEVRPTAPVPPAATSDLRGTDGGAVSATDASSLDEHEERHRLRNWVGFDDEMESLMVYDFT
ncbi:hypothetical protein BX600DRAFT_475295 [Xylariales sp. PMI_506]|nr:hypothetical protein BX600DRAFT_475295 [Xylariales sp. PMI_506]